MKKKTIILNGTTGIIGSQLYKSLIKDYKVIRISNKKTKIKNINYVNYNKYSELLKFFKSFKEIYAFLYCGWGDVYKPFSKIHINQNLKYANNSLKAYYQSGHSKFIFFGSYNEYGEFKGKISEKSSHKGILRSYEKSKKIFSDIGFLNSKKKNKTFLHLRISNVLSPLQKKNSLISYLHHNKNQPKLFLSSLDYYRDYIFIDDLIDGIRKIIKNSDQSEVINLASSKSILAKNFTKKYFHALGGKESQLVFKKNIACTYGRKNNFFKINIDKLKKKYNFQIKTSMDRGIKKTIKSFKVVG